MINFGMLRPGTTLYVPFDTFDSNDPTASVTMTGLAVTDIEIYKDGSMTQRGSDAGYTLTDTDGIDIDGITGIHGFSIDLADNTTAGFYAAGSQYRVVVSSITVDAGTINFTAATFQIGYPDAILNTTIATLASQTSFTLTAGPADDNALVGCVCLIHDVASAVQIEMGVVSAYTGSTKTVTLAADPGVFTAAATDNISFYFPINTRWLAGTALTGRDIGASVLLSNGTGTGQVSLSSGAVTAGTVSDKTGYSLTATTGLGNQTANITGNLSGSVGSIAAGGITASSIATDAIDADALAADAIAEINAAVDAALADIHLDHLLAADYDPANKPGVATALLNELVESDSGVSRFTQNALEQAPTDGGIAQTGDAYAYLVSNLGAAGAAATEAGGTGDQLTAIAWNASWNAEVQSECADALTAYGPPTATEMTAAFTEIKGATWSASTDTLEHIRDKETDIETDTQDLQTQVGTDGAGLTAIPWNSAWDAEVNAEMVDVLRTDTLPDDYAAHEAQPTIAEAILAMHQFLFEREVSGTSVTVQKPDGTTTAMTLTLDSATDPTTIHRSA